MRLNTPANLLFGILCSITIATSCFDCVVSLATAEELAARNSTEENLIWHVFLENSTVRAMVGIKFMGIFLAAIVMYLIRNDRTLRMAIMIPVALFHIWLFLQLNYGVGGGVFSFDFSDPLLLFRHLADTLSLGMNK